MELSAGEGYRADDRKTYKCLARGNTKPVGSSQTDTEFSSRNYLHSYILISVHRFKQPMNVLSLWIASRLSSIDQNSLSTF